MIISVASGKGGTGKTTVAVNLALSLNNIQFLDCDVEEPNAHIFLKLVIQDKKKAFIPVPQVDKNKCTYCGKCKEVCAYNAIAVIPSHNSSKGTVLIFDHLCHGCGACTFFCPEKAMTEIEKEIGCVEVGSVGSMEFVHGRLNVGEAMSPPVIRQVKNHINSSKTVIIDVPPGTSCPVVASINNSDFCILVTEPTPFGLNDLMLAVEVVKKLKIPFGVVVNRSDLGDEKTDLYCKKEKIPILMKIPFKKEIAAAYSKGIPIIESLPEYKKYFRELYEIIKKNEK